MLAVVEEGLLLARAFALFTDPSNKQSVRSSLPLYDRLALFMAAISRASIALEISP